MARVKKYVEVVDADGGVSDVAVPQGLNRSVPLFPDAGLDPATTPAGIAIWREDPPDGYLGQFPVEYTEEDIKKIVGGYVLSIALRASDGRLLTKKTIIKIDAPPVATADAKAAAMELKRSGANTATANTDIFERVLQLQRTAIDELKTQSSENVKMMRLELEGAAERRRAEAQAGLEKLQAESRLRQQEDQTKHEREMERAKLDRTADDQRNREVMLQLQAMQSKNTDVMIAAMTAGKNDGIGIKDLITLLPTVMPMLQGLMGGATDPGVEVSKAVATSLESMAKLAEGNQTPNPGNQPQRQLPAQQGQQQAGGKQLASGGKAAPPEGDDKKSRIIRKIGKMLESVRNVGHDPEQILDQAISHYEKMAAEDAEEGDEEPENAQTPADDVAGKQRPKSRSNSPRVASGKRGKPRPASKTPVGRGAKGNGRPKVARGARVDPAKRARGRA